MPDFNFMKPKSESIKENARPRRFPFVKFVKKPKNLPTLNIGIRKKKISEKELAKVKNRIREKSASTRRKKIVFRMILITVLLIPTFFIAQNFYWSVKEGEEIVAKQREKAYEERQKHIVEGYRQLQMNQFYEASWQFDQAEKIDPDDYMLQLGLTTTDIKICEYFDKRCGTAAKRLQALKTEYGDLPEIKKLSKKFAEMHN